jgi:hypothetical protein
MPVWLGEMDADLKVHGLSSTTTLLYGGDFAFGDHLNFSNTFDGADPSYFEGFSPYDHGDFGMADPIASTSTLSNLQITPDSFGIASAAHSPFFMS